MSIRTKFNLEFSLSENNTGGKELGQSTPWVGTTDSMDDGGTFKRRFNGGVSDVLVDINGLTVARFMAIKTNQTITFKKNSSGGEVSTIKALGTGALEGFLIMTTDDVTSLYVSVPGSTAAEVTFSFAGTI